MACPADLQNGPRVPLLGLALSHTGTTRSFLFLVFTFANYLRPCDSSTQACVPCFSPATRLISIPTCAYVLY